MRTMTAESQGSLLRPLVSPTLCCAEVEIVEKYNDCVLGRNLLLSLLLASDMEKAAKMAKILVLFYCEAEYIVNFSYCANLWGPKLASHFYHDPCR